MTSSAAELIAEANRMAEWMSHNAQIPNDIKVVGLIGRLADALEVATKDAEWEWGYAWGPANNEHYGVESREVAERICGAQFRLPAGATATGTSVAPCGGFW